MGKTLMKISVIYFMIGISFGLYMSFTHVFTLTSVHVHLNLVGWVSLALAGVFYHLYPNLERSGMAKAHFWLHNIGLPIMMISIATAILGGPEIFFLLATLGGVMTVLGVLLFGFNVLLRLDK
ncbi:cytochrome-c oxidase [Sporosarcina sp. ACRSL]|uniref:cytochrome-c oxidase n=1 Tax=Sporosarcina sp. ACRSL TaxID=2918215 RepID=UPI001EF3D9FA|nr:cytochrome-c oxidase [Sporosarcina sp. ACRSL]MCG7345880.1 cytochrome-c oxidase [Sporosarcina sp. ACRSL]